MHSNYIIIRGNTNRWWRYSLYLVRNFINSFTEKPTLVIDFPVEKS